MDLAIIKHLFRLLGITNLKLRFDDTCRHIVATFTQGGEDHLTYVKYTDLENIFTDESTQAIEGKPQTTGQPGAEELVPWGLLHNKTPK